MKKMMKRMTAVVLAVCMICTLAVSAVAAAPAVPETDGSYVYSFVDAMALERSNGASSSTYGAASAPVPETNNIAQGMWNDYYENGDLNWSYPQIIGTAGSGKSDETLVLNDTAGGSQFYQGDHLLAKLGTADTVAWFVLKIKAPVVGTYNVSVEHKTGNNNGVKEGKVHIVPAFDLGDAENYDAAAYNAQIDAIVAGGEYVLDGVVDCDGNATASNVVSEAGTVVLDDVNAKEYFVIFSADLSKSDTVNGIRFYLQSLTLTPAEESVATGNYAFTNSSGISLANGALDTMAQQYAAGTRDLKVIGYHSGITNGSMGAGMFNFGYTMYSAKDPKWVAVQVRIPADGTYNIAVNSGTVNGTTDPRTGTPMSAYMVKASDVSGTDYATLITDGNKIGSAYYGTGNQHGDYGTHQLEAGEYIIVLKAEACDPLLWTGEGALHANNFYLVSMEFNAYAAAVGEDNYTSVAAAAANAQEGEIVTLLTDYVGNIDLPAGVSLDLNGNDWTVSEYVATNANEFVIDSAADGVWTVGSMTLYGRNSNYVPLYDEAAGGYRLYIMGISVEADDYEVVGEATRFWFKVTCVQKAAFDLLKSGKCGLTFGVDLAYGGKDLDVTFDNGEGAEAFTAAWATAAENNANIWLYVDIVGLDGLTQDLTVTPTVEIAGNEFIGGSLVYTVA